MNTVLLNTINLDGGNIIIKGGGGGGGVTINNQSKSVEITENGTTEVVADAGFTGLGKVTVNVDVQSGGGGDTPSRPSWTGHADVEGLKAIGWDDEDIAYYQENGVNWNEEDDQYHLVSDDNKALYGVLTASNISSYKNKIVYLPKIDTSSRTSLSNFLSDSYTLLAVPKLNTSNVTDMSRAFSGCNRLVCVSSLDTSKVTKMDYTFSYCYALRHAPSFNMEKVTSMKYMYEFCYALDKNPQLNIPVVTSMVQAYANCKGITDVNFINSPLLENINNAFYGAHCLNSISIDFANIISASQAFNTCYNLGYAYIKNLKINLDLSFSLILSKESLLYIINNEAATSAITIKLEPYTTYPRLANDADVLEALANHPNISISQ